MKKQVVEERRTKIFKLKKTFGDFLILHLLLLLLGAEAADYRVVAADEDI